MGVMVFNMPLSLQRLGRQRLGLIFGNLQKAKGDRLERLGENGDAAVLKGYRRRAQGFKLDRGGVEIQHDFQRASKVPEVK